MHGIECFCAECLPYPSTETEARSILLSTGSYSIVDAEDYDTVKRHRWQERKSSRTSYASGRIDGVSWSIHQLVLNERVIRIDHKNGDGLDNRKENLRFATQQQNSFNSRPRGGTSQFNGVCFDSESRLWLAQITISGKNKKLGRFASEKDAAEMYDASASVMFGDFAKLNFPSSPIRKFEKFVTTGKAAEILGVSQKTVQLWFDMGKLFGHKHAGRSNRRVSLGSVIALARSQEQACGDEKPE